MSRLVEKLRNHRADLVALGVMALLTLMVFWQAFVRPDDMLREDAAHFYQPYYTFAAREVHAGRFPLWNPYTKMGVPFHASLQPSLLYPLRWGMFFTDYVRGYIATMMLHYWLTAVAAYLLLRVGMKVGVLAALAGALSIAFGGFAMGHMTHTTYWMSYPWFILLLLFIWLGVERGRWAWAIPAGGCIGLMGLVGSVHLLLILAVLLGTYVLYNTLIAAVAAVRAAVERRRVDWRAVVRPAGITIAAVVLGGLISAAQILPARSLAARSSRRAASWEFINRACAHPWRNTVQMVVPFHYGNCRLGYWGEYMYHGAIHYTGILLLLGAVVSLAFLGRDRRLWCWVVLAVVGFLVGAGEYLPVYRVLYDSFGLFREMRNPTRIFWITDIAIAVLGAVGIDRAVAAGVERARRSRVRALTVIGAAAVVLILAGSLVSLARYAADPDSLVAWLKTTKFAYTMNLRAARVAPGRVMRDFDLPSWAGVAAALASVVSFCWLVFRGRGAKLAASAVLVAVLLGDLFALSFGMIMYEDRWKILRGVPPRAKFLQEHLGLNRYAVIPHPPNVWPQNEQIVRARSVQFAIRNTLGKAEGIIDSLPRLRFVDMLLPMGIRTMDDARRWHALLGRFSILTGTKYLFVLNGLEHPIFQLDKLPGGQFRFVSKDDRFRVYENTRCPPMAYFVRRVLPAADSRGVYDRLLSRDFQPLRDAVVQGVPPAETAASSAAEPRVVNVRTVPGRWEIITQSDSPAQLVLLEGYDTGWRCRIDGADAKVYRTNDQVMSVAVPGGGHTVVFEYAPAEFRTGVVLTIIGLVVTVGLGISAGPLGRRLAALGDAGGGTGGEAAGR
ncbi:MAG: YfhO family protein, partial [Planctomycetes bacterium]|nr:YfhO family protein [Planctomycetota bacterium]